MRYLITGNTGFKGSWFTLILKYLGNEVHGLALPPEDNSLYKLAEIAEMLDSQEFIDIRDPVKIENHFLKVEPDIVLHLAAQPLVRDSYREPRVTIETNALGTFNVLEATQNVGSIRGAVIVTTDKVYKNVEQLKGYKEQDPLGGHDPYSASKSMADIVAQSWAKSFAKFPLVIARAGNVVGGGDFSKDRLIPDIINSINDNYKLKVRNLDSIRPWQHVLDCLNGYLMLANNLENVESGEAWNFGPDEDSFKSVQDILLFAKNYHKKNFDWTIDLNDHPHEAGLLTLDSSKAKKHLKWNNTLDFENTLKWTFDWYEAVLSGQTARKISLTQVDNFFQYNSINVKQ